MRPVHRDGHGPSVGTSAAAAAAVPPAGASSTQRTLASAWGRQRGGATATAHDPPAPAFAFDLTFDSGSSVAEVLAGAGRSPVAAALPPPEPAPASPRPHGRTQPPSLKRARLQHQQSEREVGVSVAAVRNAAARPTVIDLISTSESSDGRGSGPAKAACTGQGRGRAPGRATLPAAPSPSLDTPSSRACPPSTSSSFGSSPLRPAARVAAPPAANVSKARPVPVPVPAPAIARAGAGAAGAAGAAAARMAPATGVCKPPPDMNSATASIRAGAQAPFPNTSRDVAGALAASLVARCAFADAIIVQLAPQLVDRIDGSREPIPFADATQHLAAMTLKACGRYGAVVFACIAGPCLGGGGGSDTGSSSVDGGSCTGDVRHALHACSIAERNARPCLAIDLTRELPRDSASASGQVTQPASVVFKLSPFYPMHVQDMEDAAAIAPTDDDAGALAMLLMTIKTRNHPVREAVLARLMTKLVRARVVPHLPLSYGAMLVRDVPSADMQLTQVNVDAVRAFVRTRGQSPRELDADAGAGACAGAGVRAAAAAAGHAPQQTSPGILIFGEMVDLTLVDVQRLLVLAHVPPEAMDAILRVLLMQVFVTLEILYRAARFRHRDLHRQNVMVALTQPAPEPVLYQLADGTVVALPNIGLSARLIDFGLATTQTLPHPTGRSLTGQATRADGAAAAAAAPATATAAPSARAPPACVPITFKYLHTTYQCQAVLGDVVHLLSGLEAIMFSAADAWHVLRDTYLVQADEHGRVTPRAARAAAPATPIPYHQGAPSAAALNNVSGGVVGGADDADGHDRVPRTLPSALPCAGIPLQSRAALRADESHLTRFVAHMARQWGFVSAGAAAGGGVGGSGSMAAASMPATPIMYGGDLPATLPVDDFNVFDQALCELAAAQGARLP